MKAIIIGASLSGKTTVIKKLRSILDFPISEMDEELTAANKGKYPSDINHKNKILAPKIIEQLLDKNDIIFFSNTNYFSLGDLQKARNKGFKIIQIDIGGKELLKRNAKRVKKEGYEDLSKWLKGMIEYQRNIRRKGFVDGFVDGEKTTLQIVKQLKSILEI